MVGRVLGAVQKVVDTLTPPDGGRYIVTLADISTAGTSLGERRITVSSKPLNDKALTLAQKAVVMATFAAHEIGHTMVTRPRGSIVREHSQRSGFHAVANMADDIILEPFMVDRFPILADAFEFTGLWVLRTTSPSLPKVLRMSKGMTTAERFNVVLSATRYGDIADIVFVDTVTLAEKTWSRDWAKRLKALRLTDNDGFIALCDEAWNHIREEADEEPLQDDQSGQGDEPDTDEGDEDDESEGQSGDQSQPGIDEDEDEADEGESGESEGDDEGDGASDESEDGEGDEGDASGESESGSEGGSEGDESDGTTDSGESMDGASESDAQGEGEGGEPTDANAEKDASDDDHASGESGGVDGKGGGGNAEAKAPPRSEDDFAQSEVDQSMHEQSEKDPYDYSARKAEQAVRTYANTTVTSFGVHGSLPTEWS